MKNHAHITVPRQFKKMIEAEAKRRSKEKKIKIPLWEILEMYRNAHISTEGKTRTVVNEN